MTPILLVAELMNPFDKLSENLNLLMTETDISADELGRRTGLPASTIKKIRNYNNPNPTLTSLLPLAKHFAITLSQLVGDEPLPKAHAKKTARAPKELLHHIPILSWREAITWPATKKQKHTMISSEHAYHENAYALMVEEDNWENFTEGTALLIHPELKPEHKDFVIVFKQGQNIPTLKQVLFDEDHMYLKAVIQGYNVTAFTAEHVVVGVVVEYKKRLRVTER